MLLGGPVLGALFGALFGRSLTSAAKAAAMGGVVGLTGCWMNDDFGSFRAAPVNRGEGADADLIVPSDMLTSRTTDMSLIADLLVSPDMIADLAPNCRAIGLSEVSANDFTVSFHLQTTTQRLSTVLYQRVDCTANEDFWEVLLLANGTLQFQIVQSSTSNVALLKTSHTVNNGGLHSIVLKRVNGMITILIDGTVSARGMCPQELGALSPLGIAKGHPCEGLWSPLDGAVTSVCITSP